MGTFTETHSIPRMPSQSIWRHASSIANLPIDWNAQGIDLPAVIDFASYLDCIDHKLKVSHTPDECFSEDKDKVRAKAFQTIFETVYWFPQVEPALFNQLEKYKPEDCSMAHATCTVSTPDHICPPWRYVDVVAGPVPVDVDDAVREDSLEEQLEASYTSSVGNDKRPTWSTYNRPVSSSTAVPTSTSIISISGSEGLAKPTSTIAAAGTAVYAGSGSISTPSPSENDAASSVFGLSYVLIKVPVPLAAGVAVALL